MPTRVRLLTAAIWLFAQNGYHGTTLDDIAARAKLSKMTVVRHFKTKEHIFDEALFEAIRQAGLGNGHKDYAHFKADFGSWARHYAHQLNQNPHVQRLFLYAALDHPETIRKILVTFTAPLYDYLLLKLIRAKSAGAIRDLPPHAVIRSILGMLVYHHLFGNVMLGKKLHKFHVSPKDIDCYLDIWFHGILAEQSTFLDSP